MAHLLGKETPLPAVGAELSGVQASGLQHHRELVGRAPTLGILLGGRHHFPLQPPGLAPLVESDHVDPQLPGDLRHALAMGRPHPEADISLDGLAVTIHGSVLSSPLVVEVVGIERRHLSWQRGPCPRSGFLRRP